MYGLELLSFVKCLEIVFVINWHFVGKDWMIDWMFDWIIVLRDKNYSYMGLIGIQKLLRKKNWEGRITSVQQSLPSLLEILNIISISDINNAYRPMCSQGRLKHEQTQWYRFCSTKWCASNKSAFPQAFPEFIGSWLTCRLHSVLSLWLCNPL